MNILVTGAAGFIGSNLCKVLIDEGHFVLGLDNLSTGTVDNVSPYLKSSLFEFVEHDIIDPFYPKLDIDMIYNLACPASPPRYQKDPIWTVKTNTIGMINMLGLARAHGAKILQTSTSEVYGDPLEHPQKESYFGNVNPIGPRSCYDEGKRVSETLCVEYYRTHKLPIRIARLFNTYGPNMDPEDGRVVSNFIVNALQGKPLVIYGNGNQTRSFCYVDDIIEALVRFGIQETFSGPVNLGNPSELTIKHFAEEVLKLIPESKSKVVYESAREDDPKIRQPDISLAKEKLKWEPKVPLKEGLMKTISYFREKIQA